MIGHLNACDDEFSLQSVAPGLIFVPPFLKGDVLCLKVYIIHAQSGHLLGK